MTVFISKFAKNISEGIKKVNKGICIEIGVLFAPISYVILEYIGVNFNLIFCELSNSRYKVFPKYYEHSIVRGTNGRIQGHI